MTSTNKFTFDSDLAKAAPIPQRGIHGVAGDQFSVAPGSWLRMVAGTRHAMTARTDLLFALYLLPG